MKNLLIILFVALFTLNVNAQNPIAVNDTFYCFFEQSITVQRSQIYNNDSLGNGVFKIIDTIIYNGVNQFTPTYLGGGLPFWGLNKFVYTAQPGYFGIDSLTYILTDNGVPTGFDTATIYIYVKVNSYNLDLNNVSARIDPEVLFQNREISPAISAFNVPKQANIGIDPYLGTIYAANLWIAGEDINGNIKVFAPTYSFEGPFSGPIMDVEYIEPYSYKWDRVWKVSQSIIEYHITNYRNLCL